MVGSKKLSNCIRRSRVLYCYPDLEDPTTAEQKQVVTEIKCNNQAPAELIANSRVCYRNLNAANANIFTGGRAVDNINVVTGSPKQGAQSFLSRQERGMCYIAEVCPSFPTM